MLKYNAPHLKSNQKKNKLKIHPEPWHSVQSHTTDHSKVKNTRLINRAGDVAIATIDYSLQFRRQTQKIYLWFSQNSGNEPKRNEDDIAWHRIYCWNVRSKATLTYWSQWATITKLLLNNGAAYQVLSRMWPECYALACYCNHSR